MVAQHAALPCMATTALLASEYRNSICSWLDSVHQGQQENAATTSQSQLQSLLPRRQGTKRQRALMDIDANPASSPPKRPREKPQRLTPATATATPRRSERHGRHRGEAEESRDEDGSKTPRAPQPSHSQQPKHPSHHAASSSPPLPLPQIDLSVRSAPRASSEVTAHSQQLRNSPAWPPSYASRPSSQADLDSIGASSAASGATSTITTATSRARSRSPVKKKMDLAMCTHRVDYKAVPGTRKELPRNIQALWQDLLRVAQSGIGVLPHELQVRRMHTDTDVYIQTEQSAAHAPCGFRFNE